MAAIAGLKDFREHGAPADIGTFALASTAVVFKYTHSGTDYWTAIRADARGWVLIDNDTDPATVVNSALSAAGINDVTLVMSEDWTITTTFSVPEGVYLQGTGWNYSLLYDAGGNCVTVTGDNVKIRDLKIDIVAGAGGAGTRPNCIYADTRTNIEITKVWLIGDESVADDGSDLRQCGVVFDTVTYSRVALCKSNDHMRHGISLGSSTDNTVTGNTCNGNTENGIRLGSSTDNTVTGNTCTGNDSGDTGTYDGINIDDETNDNLIMCNTCDDNDRYGIRVNSADCLRNWIKNNQLRGNTAGPFSDIGTDTKLATIPIPLVQGTTFISAAGEAWGWKIELADEFALGIGWLPLEVQQVVRIRVIGVALAAPGVGNYMRIQITGDGGTFGEDYATEPIDVVDKNNNASDPAIDEPIQWVFTPTDDADIGHLLGGDRLQIKVLHEGGDAPQIETNAIVDTVQVEYV